MPTIFCRGQPLLKRPLHERCGRHDTLHKSCRGLHRGPPTLRGNESDAVKRTQTDTSARARYALPAPC